MEIVLANPSAELLQVIRRRFLPNAVVMAASEAPQPMPAVDHLPTVYVCENYACKLPVTSPQTLEDLLQ
jgi:uncharacterized protein YyaL (SSP411 family)